MEALLRHSQLCDELHQLVLEEQRILTEQQRAPEPAFLERKKALLPRLETALAALRDIPAEQRRDQAFTSAAEKLRTRIMQILQIDRENERLLLRLSTGATRPTETPAPSPALLKHIYGRNPKV